MAGKIIGTQSWHLVFWNFVWICVKFPKYTSGDSMMAFSLGNKFSNSFVVFQESVDIHIKAWCNYSDRGIPWDLPCNCGLSVCEAYERPAADSNGPVATGSNVESCCRHRGSTALFPVTDPG